MNYIRAVGISRFILVILCIALVLSVAVCGIDSWGLGGIFEKDTIRLGLDLSGGSIITYSAVTEDTGDTLAKGMNGILESMRTRLDSQGLTEANVYLVGDKMITLEIPNVTDPNEAVEQFGAAAVLTFKNADGDIILEGRDVAEAKAGYYQNEDGVAEWLVQLKLTDEGAEKFAAATKEAAANGTNITTYIDDELISTAGVDKKYAEEGITGGEASISGSFDRDSARALAGNINAGALAYNLSLEELRAVGPTLGEKSLETSLQAGAIGLLLVAIFMIIYYRIPGLMASIALCAYVGLFMLVLALTKANLTLPGIAGIILSIGMAVDANVIIFERIKEEIRGGKSTKAALKAGFSRAFSAILDSNVTTFIAAGVLYVLGSGSIKGFAITLGLGVILSMFTALVVTKYLLKLSIEMNLSTPALFGVREKKAVTASGTGAESKKIISFVGSKVTLIVVCVILVIGVGSFVIRGFNIDIDFSGGTEIQINLGREITPEICDEINGIIESNEKLGHKYVSSTTKSGADSNTAIIRTGSEELSNEQQDALLTALEEKYDINREEVELQITSVSPSIGSNLKQTAVIAILVAIVLMLAYISIRFKVASGISAIICLVHDLFVMLIAYSLLQIPVNINIIAALLTILGYSINATIVIFDRVRENRKRAGESENFGETVDTSIRQSLSRSVNTTLTTLFTIGMVFIFGVDSIRNFALPLIVGLVAGLFSSVCLSGPVWVMIDKAFSKKSEKKAATAKTAGESKPAKSE